ncbi:MAG: WYL domain-containing protein [Gallionella sp.]|nr:WYL domain-containing protein [Gallionella sp.]
MRTVETNPASKTMAKLHPDTLLRQWQMLRMIPRFPLKITAGDLHQKLRAEQFDVTKRTVERDLLSLSEMFPLVSDERDRPFGWSWSKDAHIFSLPGLSHTEALTLAMVEQHLNTLLPSSTLQQLQPYFDAAKHHLKSIPQSERTRSCLNKVRTVPPSQPLLPPNIKPVVQQTVYEALLADHQLDIKYLKRGQKIAVEYRIHPIAVVQRGHITYLYCRISDHEDLRTLAVHRIQSATMLDEKTDVPSGFSIDEAINSGKFGFFTSGLITLEAIFYNGVGDHLFETPLSREQTLTELENGAVKLVATVPNTLQLGWWILGLGDGIEVIQPTTLRDQIASTIDKMQARYRE